MRRNENKQPFHAERYATWLVKMNEVANVTKEHNVICYFVPFSREAMADIPTVRQFEALKYVYFEQLTYSEAAERMGITKQAVEGLLKRLCETHPDFKDILNIESSTPRRFITYVDNTDYDIEDTF